MTDANAKAPYNHVTIELHCKPDGSDGLEFYTDAQNGNYVEELLADIPRQYYVQQVDWWFDNKCTGKNLEAKVFFKQSQCPISTDPGVKTNTLCSENNAPWTLVSNEGSAHLGGFIHPTENTGYYEYSLRVREAQVGNGQLIDPMLQLTRPPNLLDHPLFWLLLLLALALGLIGGFLGRKLMRRSAA